MKYRQWRHFHSQNYLRDPKLVSKLVRNSSIGNYDTVIEIGPGRGVITGELINKAGKVIAVEIDRNSFNLLNNKFKNANNLQLINSDFLKFNLPDYPYKVFANIPFRFTADIVKKLTVDPNFIEGYLIVQLEAAKKIIGKPFDSKNSMQSILLKPWFDIDLIWKFNRSDFIPIPNVDCMMIKIKRRNQPFVSKESQNNFENFIIYAFNKKRISCKDFSEILRMFNNYDSHASNWEKKIVNKTAEKVISDQSIIQKIHRTRNDKNWRRYK